MFTKVSNILIGSYRGGREMIKTYEKEMGYELLGVAVGATMITVSLITALGALLLGVVQKVS